MTKIEALTKHLKIELSEVSKKHCDDSFEIGREEYIVLNDSEADEKAKEYILDSLWAFVPSFLAAHISDVSEEMIKKIQENCENANPVILKLLDDKEHFIQDALRSDGRGHFLNTYDGEEHEISWQDDKGDRHSYFIYRTN